MRRAEECGLVAVVGWRLRGGEGGEGSVGWRVRGSRWRYVL